MQAVLGKSCDTMTQPTGFCVAADILNPFDSSQRQDTDGCLLLGRQREIRGQSPVVHDG